jgi:hypothetical protein
MRALELIAFTNCSATLDPIIDGTRCSVTANTFGIGYKQCAGRASVASTRCITITTGVEIVIVALEASTINGLCPILVQITIWALVRIAQSFWCAACRDV